MSLGDWAPIAVMVYTFSLVGRVVTMKLEDYNEKSKRWWFPLNAKGGKHQKMLGHHNAGAYIHAYLDASGL